MQVHENKQQLFDFLSEILLEKIGQPEDRDVFATRKELVFCSDRMFDAGNLSPCAHEEVNKRIVSHAKVQSDKG